MTCGPNFCLQDVENNPDLIRGPGKGACSSKCFQLLEALCLCQEEKSGCHKAPKPSSSRLTLCCQSGINQIETAECIQFNLL